MDSYNEDKASMTKEEAIDAFIAEAKKVDNRPIHTGHSHCHQCGAEATWWKEETQNWWCYRCASAADHAKLGRWFDEHFDGKLHEGGLASNVIRLLSQREDVPSLPEKKNGQTTFNLICTMKDRWVPHFLAMLKYMQRLGGIGSSRLVSFMADGDGDFNPKFTWHNDLPSEADSIKDEGGHKTFDAG